MHTFRQARRHGFTIVELLIVIVIIGILAAITIIAFNGIQGKAKIAVIQSDLNQASKSLDVYRATTSTEDKYPSTLSDAKLTATNGTTYQYSYLSALNRYCLTGTNSGLVYTISSIDTIPKVGACAGHVGSGGVVPPAGYEIAPVASGSQTAFDGNTTIQPLSCPTTGGLWVKVPGNSLYGTDNGFCVQQYPATKVGTVATSQPEGPRWTGVGVSQPTSKTHAETAATGSHLFTEGEWMTMATNAAAQPQNWSGGAVGNGTLPTGNSVASYHGASVVLSNGETIYFDTGVETGKASSEFTCYTGPSASNCGLESRLLPIPQNAYHTDQFAAFTSYGVLPTNAASRYYGDPRYANPALGAYVSYARNTGLGYLRSGYTSGSTSMFNFIRGPWNGASSSGLFTLYASSFQTYEHAAYGFRAAK